VKSRRHATFPSRAFGAYVSDKRELATLNRLGDAPTKRMHWTWNVFSPRKPVLAFSKDRWKYRGTYWKRTWCLAARSNRGSSLSPRGGRPAGQQRNNIGTPRSTAANGDVRRLERRPKPPFFRGAFS